MLRSIRVAETQLVKAVVELFVARAQLDEPQRHSCQAQRIELLGRRLRLIVAALQPHVENVRKGTLADGLSELLLRHEISEPAQLPLDAAVRWNPYTRACEEKTRWNFLYASHPYPEAVFLPIRVGAFCRDKILDRNIGQGRSWSHQNIRADTAPPCGQAS